MFNDGHDVPVVIQEIVGIAHFEIFCFGGPVVHQQIVRAFHVASLEKHESARNVSETLAVDAVDYFHSAGRVKLRSEEHTSELQSHLNLVCRLLLEKKKPTKTSSDLTT